MKFNDFVWVESNELYGKRSLYAGILPSRSGSSNSGFGLSRNKCIPLDGGTTRSCSCICSKPEISVSLHEVVACVVFSS